jgi:hypothetical protein
MNHWLKNTHLVAQNMKYDDSDVIFAVVQLEAGNDCHCHII